MPVSPSCERGDLIDPIRGGVLQWSCFLDCVSSWDLDDERFLPLLTHCCFRDEKTVLFGLCFNLSFSSCTSLHLNRSFQWRQVVCVWVLTSAFWTLLQEMNSSRLCVTEIPLNEVEIILKHRLTFISCSHLVDVRRDMFPTRWFSRFGAGLYLLCSSKHFVFV